MSAHVSLKIRPALDELRQITAAVEDLALRENWSQDLEFKVNLVLDELSVNIVNYGGEVSMIEVSLSSEEESVTIEITDDGRPFDPLNDAVEPDIKAPLEERPIGGLGLYFVRTMMDEMHYRREQGKNFLALAKRRAE